MHLLYTPYILPLLAAGFISGWVAVYSWARRKTQGAVALMILALLISEWTFTYALEIAGADLPTKLLFGKLQYIGITLAPLMWLIFAFNHADQARIMRHQAMLLLGIEPILTMLMVATTETSGLVWKDIGVQQAGAFSVLSITHGIWFWVHLSYSYLLLLAGTVIVLRTVGRSKGVYRGQASALLLAVAAPWVGNALYITGFTPIPYLDLTPFAFTITTVAFAWGIFGFRLIDLSPLARASVIDEMQDGMIVLDLEGMVADINPFALRLVRQPAAQVIGRPGDEVFSRWPHLVERYQALTESIDEVIIPGENGPDWYELRLSPLRDQQKRLIGRVIIVRDISRRKRAEEQIRLQAAALASAANAIIITGLDGTIQWVNPAFTALTGYSAESAIGQRTSLLKSGYQDPAFYRALWQTILSGQVWHGILVNRRADGSQYTEEQTITPVRDEQGQITWFIAIKQDITASRKAHEQLRQLSRAVEASPASIVITDAEGNIEYANPKFTQITGYRLDEVLGQNPRVLKTEHTPIETHRHLWETILAGQEWHGEFCNRKKNGELFWESASISPINDADGKVRHFVAVKEDITARKEAETALAIAHDQALEASRLKSQLLAKVSHELRTPLSGILGFAELMHNDTFGPLNDGQRMAAAQIIDSAHYLDMMVNELLDQAQIESRTMILHMARFSPTTLLQRIETNMSLLARNRGLAFSTSLEPGVPSDLYGDQRRLEQILINLIGNAIKFTKHGEVCVRLYQAGPQHWAMQVRDTGVGIPKDAQELIFEPFRQVNNAVTHENRGTGLGLSITRQLVELMEGRITLESEVGRGSSFTITLPILKVSGKN